MAKTSHQGILPLVHRILLEDTSPLGLTFQDVLAATNGQLAWKQCSSALQKLKGGGKCVSTGSYRDDRYYYATRARMEACAEAVAARLAEVRKQRKEHQRQLQREYERRYDAHRPARAPTPSKPKAPRPKKAKPAAAPKPKPVALPATVTVRRTPAQRWANAEPIIPPGVKVTVCPPCRPRTFAPPPWFRGEFTNEWQQLREQTDARPRSKAAGRRVSEMCE